VGVPSGSGQALVRDEQQASPERPTVLLHLARSGGDSASNMWAWARLGPRSPAGQAGRWGRPGN